MFTDKVHLEFFGFIDLFTGKSKNSSRSKDGQKQQATPAAQKPAIVPQPQPTKPNSKASKKSDLNQKGANKEGTDMDAFNDNVQSEEINVDLSQVVNETNVNTVVNNVTTEPATIVDACVIESNKKNTEPPIGTTTIKSADNKTLPKSKIDVTDIVKEKPKSIKPYPVADVAQDETDKAVFANNDKLVQVRNEVNAKTIVDSLSGALLDDKLPYKEGKSIFKT